MAKTQCFSEFRRSRKRLERIRLRGNWPNPIELGLTLLAIAIIYAMMWRANAWY